MNSSAAPTLMFGFFALVILGAIVIAVIVHRKRQEALRAWANQRGWHFEPVVHGLTKRWSGPPFVRNVPAREVLTGAFRGYNALSFKYTYTSGSGKNQTTHTYHIVALHLPAPLLWLRLSPEGIGTAIGKFFGGQDVQLESKAFNDEWRVQGPDNQFTFDFLHPRMMERLMQHDALGRNIVLDRNDLYIWRTGNQDLNAIDYYLSLLVAITEQIPRHLWLRMGYDPLQK